MWIYEQATGALYHNDTYVGKGYSGTGTGRDNPAAQAEVGVGPIPTGLWKIGPAYRHWRLGPVVMNLDPVWHNAYGRTLFRIHGDNKKNDASNGCIILSRSLRELIAASGDRELTVV